MTEKIQNGKTIRERSILNKESVACLVISYLYIIRFPSWQRPEIGTVHSSTLFHLLQNLKNKNQHQRVD